MGLDEIDTSLEWHNSLIGLAENNFRDLKCFKAKIFEKEDHKDFLYFAVMLLQEAKTLKEESQKPWGGHKPSKPKQFEFRKVNVVKRGILLGIGSEYLLKAIFLAKGRGINRIIKNIKQLSEPYKIDSSKCFLDSNETVTFGYLREHILKIVDCSVFNEGINKQRNEERIDDEKKKADDRVNGVPSPKAYPYKKPDSNGCLNLIYGIRNNYAHSVFIKPEFFEDAFNFIDFLTQETFNKRIEQLFEEYKPEENKPV